MTGSSARISSVLSSLGRRVRNPPIAQYAVAPRAENHGA
jgi:hypothetical protein